MNTPPGKPDSTTDFLDAGGAQGLQVGSYNVQHNQFGYIPPVVRSAYLEQVRRIAPSELKDRDTELVELAAFCTGAQEYAYAWWRAPAWAGKSALMSWFALHPPLGVRIVSFFVTARHDRQNDRKAFVDNVLEQLAELLEHRGLPAGLTESTQDAHLASMLAAAAAECQQSGERLVLLVDGLDEDRGVTVGPASYSIAATLPRHPPTGLRIVVTSRSDPPLPPDMLPDHPLRGQCLVRELTASSYATVVRADAERELKRILLSGGVEREILGFVTAARSGLSVRDLAELVDEDEWLVEDYLTSFTGRTFANVDAAYVLAHEELQSTATRLLGPARLSDYRQRLHEWADRYRERAWPAGTPDYLLRGYFRMLSEQGDTARMVRYAADTARHDRMLDQTGGDAVALEEITLAQDALLSHFETDLPAMCELALRRTDLEERNTNVPLALPRLWAAVGNIARAEALVRSIPEEGNRRAVALTLLAPEVAEAGHHARAELLAGLLPANMFVDENQPAKTICEIARMIARGGDHDRATALAGSIDAPFWHSRAHGEVAIAIASTGGDLEEAEALALQIPMPYWRAQALAVLAQKAATRGQSDLAERMAGRAENEAGSLPSDSDKAFIHAFLAQEIESWGGRDQARRLAALAVTGASTVEGPHHRVDSLTKILPFLDKILDPAELAHLAGLAESTLITARDEDQIPSNYSVPRLISATAVAWYTAGDVDRAVAAATSITDPSERDDAILRVTGAAAAAGDLVSARQLADSLSDPAQTDRALVRIVNNLAGENDEDHLADLVNAVRDRADHAAALTEWGYRVAKRGNLETATDLAKRAEAIGRSTGAPDAKAKLLTPLITALVSVGDTERARAAARQATAAYHSVPEKHRLDSELAALVRATVATGDYETAADATRLIQTPKARVGVQAELASSITRRESRDIAVGLLETAEMAAMSMPGQYERLKALGKILTALWTLGEDARAETLGSRMVARDDISEPSQPARTPVFPVFHAPGERVPSPASEQRDQALAKAVEDVAEARDFTRAETLSGFIATPRLQAEARTSLVLALARAGQHDRAHALALSDGGSHYRDRRLSQLADTLTDQGDIDSAEKVARSITDHFYRVKALITLARRVDPAKAQLLLLVPIRHGRLADVMDLITEICPQAIRVLTDHLLSEERAEQAT
ncbi:hypothetical protein OG792_21255 [Micromonospora sp. NBC_01699]|uniref:hypothetical protein n=1 Tax=Micromonospora sp. NBC_01699 TaxID=2975984 RepID=UPI002E2E5500|nr:hypothetical protein [Micromonospora sp. NBC_01699]